MSADGGRTEDEDGLCCCEFLSSTGERSHLLGLCCDCEVTSLRLLAGEFAGPRSEMIELCFNRAGHKCALQKFYKLQTRRCFIQWILVAQVCLQVVFGYTSRCFIQWILCAQVAHFLRALPALPLHLQTKFLPPLLFTDASTVERFAKSFYITISQPFSILLNFSK